MTIQQEQYERSTSAGNSTVKKLIPFGGYYVDRWLSRNAA